MTHILICVCFISREKVGLLQTVVLSTEAEMRCYGFSMHDRVCNRKVSLPSKGVYGDELTTTKLLGELNSQELLIVCETKIVNDVVSPYTNQVDTQASVMVIPHIVMVFLQVVILEVLEERVMLLGGYGPIV